MERRFAMSRQISPATSLITLRREAKRWLKQLHANDSDAQRRFEKAYPNGPTAPVLRDVQHALAREFGLEHWAGLTKALERSSGEGTASGWPTLTAEGYDRLANDVVLAHNAKDAAALQRVNAHYQRTFTFDDLWGEVWSRLYSFRQRAFSGAGSDIRPDEAQILVAQDAGFSSWAALTSSAAPIVHRVPPYVVDPTDDRIAPRRQLSGSEWDDLLAVMRERRISRLDAGGMMTDEVLSRVAALDHVTTLSLGGSRQLTDDGLLHLARMPQLAELDLSEYPGGKLTDRGLEVLRHLPNLRRFEMTWQRGISDLGVSNLKHCDRLEQVNLMGSPTGDGAIEALQGKLLLRNFSTGRQVTDAGLAVLQHFPHFKTWNEGREGHLLIDGPFTNAGLATLAGLEGIASLDLFWHVTGITSSGFAHLAALPNLAGLAADGALSNDEAMRHFAAMPRLRNLRAQESVATDAGFEALSRSQTLEGFWGRKCANFGSRGFVALSRMPALRSLGIGCANVDDRALATLPLFPALRELTPIDVKDDGFAHVGKCERLERLTCMYCRDTTDRATEHIAGLHITYYYAGLTLITDRSLETLGTMPTLEQVEFYECNGVTDAGLAHLARLPRLREVVLEELPGVTLEGTHVFPAHVRVKYVT